VPCCHVLVCRSLFLVPCCHVLVCRSLFLVPCCHFLVCCCHVRVSLPCAGVLLSCAGVPRFLHSSVKARIVLVSGSFSYHPLSVSLLSLFAAIFDTAISTGEWSI
jgi:hypothetical protein